MKVLQFFINSNLVISLGALLWTFAAQIQLGIEPALHPYLFLIFFATLFEYNLHRLITIWNSPEALDSPKHSWVKNNKNWFYFLVLISIVGFTIAIFMAKMKVLLTLAPLAAITIFYSTPLGKNGEKLFRLRQIPYLKIFMISLVWAIVTVLLPVIETEVSVPLQRTVLLIIERFFFILAITIPFDIRDMETDRLSNLKTIPLALGKKSALKISRYSLLAYSLIGVLHYSLLSNFSAIAVTLISFSLTYSFLINKRIQSSLVYHYGFLDGSIILQALLFLTSNYLMLTF